MGKAREPLSAAEVKELISKLEAMPPDNPEFIMGISILSQNLDSLDKLGLEAVRRAFDLIAKGVNGDEDKERKPR